MVVGMPTAAPVPRPSDDDVLPMVTALRWQHDVVLAAGSPVAAQILRAVVEDSEGHGSLAQVLPRSVRFGDFPGLRVMAAVHRLAIERSAPRVAMHLPTLGGAAPATDAERAAFRLEVIDVLAHHATTLLASLDHTPQTNETGRAALLRCALSREDDQRRVRLREIGSSAGLNLRADQLPGNPRLESGPLAPVLDRIGCDLHPVDASTSEGRTLLSSYIWADDVARFARLRQALDVAQRVPARVVQMDAVDFCAGLAPQRGATTVLWHSAMWAYLPRPTRSGILAEMARAGSLATPDGPFLHVSWEWDTSLPGMAPFGLVVRRWEGATGDGTPRLIATGTSHGADARLVPGGPSLEVDPLLV
jgi:hypothetical protein